MALLRSAFGGALPLIGQPGGKPLLPAGPNIAAGGDVPPPGQPSDPAAPSTWTQAFFDDFAGTSLDRTKWGLVYSGGTASNGAMTWDPAGIIVNNGLTLRAFRTGSTWYGGGIQQGNTGTGLEGYGDFQVSVRARFPQGQGVGALAAMWPVSDQWPPEFDIVETPGRAKDRVLATWRWPGNQAGVSASYAVDATQYHIYTVRRTGNLWNYWIDGLEKAVPPEWAQNADASKLALGFAAFVAAAGDTRYGGAPDATTPATWDANVSWVRVYTPAGTGPGTGGDPTATQRLKAFRADLRVGVDVERNGLVRAARMTAAVFAGYKAAGLTHVRLWVGAGGTLPIPSNVADINPHLDACERAMAAGLKVRLDLLDAMQPADWSNAAVQPYLSSAAAAIAARNWDVSKYALGACHEYAGGTNTLHRTGRDASIATLRGRLPSTILVSGAAEGNSPWQLTNGSYNPPSDPLVLHDYHLFHAQAADEADQRLAADDAAKAVAHWESTAGAVAMCGQWAIGPASGVFNGVTVVDADDYFKFPATIRAATTSAMWQHGPTFYTATDGALWRLNVSATDPSLRTEVAAETLNGSTAIARRDDYKARLAAEGTTGGGGGGDPTGATIALNPQNPPALVENVAGQGASTPFIVTTTGITSLVYVVVRNDAGFTWREPRQTVSTTGTVTISPTFFAQGDFLKVLKADDFSVGVDSGQVSITLAGSGGGTGTTALAKARAVVAPLTVGVNIDRAQPITDGWITGAYLNGLKAQGVTHIRLIAPSGGDFALMSQQAMAPFYDLAATASADYGFGVLLHLADTLDQLYLARSDFETFITSCGDSLAARNLDPAKVMVGVCNEYGGGTNQGHEAAREKLLDILHAKLPNHVLLTGASNSCDPYRLVDGTMKVQSAKPRVHLWHHFPLDATSQAAAQDVDTAVRAWAERNAAVAMCGEYGSGGAPTDLGSQSTMIDAAVRGAGRQRPTFWRIAGGTTASAFRLNDFTSASLRPAVATALGTADDFTREQTWWQQEQTAPGGGGGGGTSIDISPLEPGTLAEQTAGQGATRSFTITTSGLSSFDWVVVRPDYSWRTSPVAVATAGTATINVTFMQTGEFLKILKTGDYSVYRDSAQAVVTPAPGSVDAGAQAARNFVAPLTVGINLERGSVWSMSYNGQSLQSNRAYYDYLASIKITHVRLFYAYRPNVDMLGEGATGGSTPSNGQIGRILDCTQRAVDAGLKVFLDMTDVIEPSECQNNWSTVSAYLDRFAGLVAARGFPVNMVCVGPFNELAYGTWAEWNTYRIQAHNILRAKLPNHTLMTNAPDWGHFNTLFSAGYEETPDTNVIAQYHSYEPDQSVGRWATVKSQGDAFSAAHGGIPVVSGEQGYGGWFGDDDISDGNTWANQWATNFSNYCQAAGLHRPMTWAMTGGNAWRMNREWNDPTLREVLEDNFVYNDGVIRDLPGFGGGSQPPPTNTPQTLVDAEYAFFSGTPLATGKSGPLQTGQSNCGYFISEAYWWQNEGITAICGVPKGTYNPQINGIGSLDAYGLPQSAKTEPFEAYTTYGGMPLYGPGDSGAFLNRTGGGAASTWPYGWGGENLDRFITLLMTADERATCHGVQILHNEADAQHGHDFNEYKAARLRHMQLVRQSFGRPATGNNGLPFFFVAPIPYSSNTNGHRTIRRAWWEICQDPANNAHIVVWNTADSLGGLRHGATSRDYDHRSTEDLVRWARMASFGVSRILNSQRGIGSRNPPSFGPKILHAYAEDGDRTLITVAHDRGTDIYLGGNASSGNGWVVDDNGTNRGVSSVDRVNANQLRIWHAYTSGTQATRGISYCEHNGQVGWGNAVYDNFSSRPAPSGWPSGWGSEWKFDWPLRSTFVPFMCSSSPYSG